MIRETFEITTVKYDFFLPHAPSNDASSSNLGEEAVEERTFIDPIDHVKLTNDIFFCHT